MATARRLAHDVAPEVRATALGALARCGALGADDLASAAADEDRRVRRRAAELLATWEPTGAIDLAAGDRGLPAAATGAAALGAAVARLLADDDPTVVEAAAWAMGEHVSRAVEHGRNPVLPDQVPTLIELATGHDDPLVREAAVAALGAIGDERGRRAILAALSDKPAIRRRAVLALAPFDGPDVEAALERARHDRDWQVRQAAEDLIDS